jgi:hypothetical protein
MATEQDKKFVEQGADVERGSEDDVSIGAGDILQLEHTDPVLNMKMHLVNNVRLPLAIRARAE